MQSQSNPLCSNCQLRPVKAKGLCHNCYQKAWTAKHPEKIRAGKAAYYAAQSIEWKAVQLERLKAWDATHPEKLLQRKRKYRAAHREQLLGESRSYDSLHRKERRIAAAARAVAYPERKRAAYRKWVESHREETRDRAQRRAALKRDPAADHITTDELYTRDKSRCALCHKQVKRAEASIDHIIPVSRRGIHTWANVQLAHWKCNHRRGAGAIPAQTRLF